MLVMDDSMRKITVEVPERDLVAAQELTGAGVTETVRAGLRKLLAERSQREFRKLRGTYKFKIGLDELREDRKTW
jgi:Arc/MetJ-type ribon-helix-helix transcriptional regulator